MSKANLDELRDAYLKVVDMARDFGVNEHELAKMILSLSQAGKQGK